MVRSSFVRLGLWGLGMLWLSSCSGSSPGTGARAESAAVRAMAGPTATAMATASAAPRDAVARVRPAALAPCGVSAPGTAAAPLAGDELEGARRALAGGEGRLGLAAALGVDCPPASPGFDVAVVQALARFQRRYGRFEDEVTGRLDERTERVLAMIHPALRGPEHPCRGVAESDTGPLPSCLLRWEGATAEQLAFMRRVYEVAQQQAAKRREYVEAANEVGVIERGPCPGKPSEIEPGCERTHWAERDAAEAARRLLLAARATFDADRARHGQRNLLVFTGYRSAAFQLQVWEYHFPTRYLKTQRARARARGGAHGPAAALLLAQYFAARTAAPGYSLHSRGLAIDFGCVTRAGDWIGSNGTFVAAWKSSHCFQWLKQNAARFGFRPNDKIDEPWHWEFVGGTEP